MTAISSSIIPTTSRNWRCAASELPVLHPRRASISKNQAEERSRSNERCWGESYAQFRSPWTRNFRAWDTRPSGRFARPDNSTRSRRRMGRAVRASVVGPEEPLVAAVFQLATAFVVPFYAAMIFAPRREWTRKLVTGELASLVLGAAYVYLLCRAWTPETLRILFAGPNLLPELPGITRMFSSTLTVASAWLHLLAVDLFAGKHVFLDGAKHDVETRHSLLLCLFMCPVGLFSHSLTKLVVLSRRRRRARIEADAPDVQGVPSPSLLNTSDMPVRH